MKLQNLLSFLALSTFTHATIIYVSSYSGNITTISITPNSNGGNLTLTAISSTNGCSPNPSWIKLDKSTSYLYCADEGLNTPMANFASFQTSQNGNLALFDNTTTLNGGVYSKIYSNGTALALANYGGSGITIIDILKQSHLDVLQKQLFEFHTNVTNPKTNQPVHPYIHQTIIDPTEAFLLAPDLSADLIHVFSISPSHTIQHPPIQIDISVPKGHGPRHGVFYQPGNGDNCTYLYVVMETANMVHAYNVTYNADNTLSFNLTQYLQLPVPVTAAAAEIKLTPDNKYLIVSSRSDNSFTIPNPDPTNNTHITSDTLFTFLISPSNGQISLVQSFPAGGLLPRQFEISKNGTMLAVALNGDNRLVVLGRNVASGNMTSILGSLDIDVEGKGPGMVTCAIWHEDFNQNFYDGGWNMSGASPVLTQPSPNGTPSSITTLASALPTPSTPAEKSILSELVGVMISVAALEELEGEAQSLKSSNPASATQVGFELLNSMIALEGDIASITSNIPASATDFRAHMAPLSSFLASAAALSSALASATEGNPVSVTDAAIGVLKSMLGTGIPGSAKAIATVALTAGSTTAIGAAAAASTPTPFQAGMVANCTSFYRVVANDTCSGIATTQGISLSDFYTWNPAVGSSCGSLDVGNNVCIGEGTYN